MRAEGFDRVYAKEFARRKAEYGRDGELPQVDLSVPPEVFPRFIRVLERQADRVKAEVGGRLYWIIYGADPRWEEIH
jgi:hypothetical protein